MPRLIESPADHLALHIGSLTAQNVALSCALEQREQALADARARIDDLELELGALTPPKAAAGQAGAEPTA